MSLLLSSQFEYAIVRLGSLWSNLVSRLSAMAGAVASDHSMQRFLSESLELLRRLSSLKFAHLSVAVLVLVIVVLVFSLGIWRLRVSRYNEFWGLKKSVHFWTSFRTSAQPHYCSACSQLICGFWIFRNTGWECTVCGRTAHMRCLAACDKFDCKCPSQPDPLRHQLAQGNLPSDSVCGVCGIICASPFGLHGLRCLWCGRTVHEECLRHLPDVCDFGKFENLLLPPSLVRLSVASSRLPHSLKSLKSFFHTKKHGSHTTSEEASVIADLSGSTQRYLSQMGAQLKEGLSQVQIAMAAGLFEGLKEVTADVRRFNQLVKQEFRRRMKRELQQIENQKLKQDPDTSVIYPEDDGDAADGLLPGTVSPKTNEQLQDTPGAISSRLGRAASSREHRQGENRRTRSSSGPFNRMIEDDCVIVRRATISVSSTGLCRSRDCQYKNHVLRRRHRRCRPPTHMEFSVDQPILPSTTVATPEEILQSVVHKRQDIRQRGVTETGSIHSGSSDRRRVKVDFKENESNDNRLRFRQFRAEASPDVLVREDRYDDRLFELAKLMPAKADVWQIDLSNYITLWKSKQRKNGTNRLGQIPSALLDRKPLLVFVNVKSGGQVGLQLLKEFYKVLNPMQVVDIQSDGGPHRALQLFKCLADINRLRVLVCGGDGSAGWVMEVIRRLYGPPTECQVPVGILPLGTGNDLSRVLGWGDTFDGDIHRYLCKVQTAQTRLIDQWNLKLYNQTTEMLNTCFNNYMDIGIAARIALKFHTLREAHPELFQSKLGNQFLYGEMGVREWVSDKSIDLSKVKLWCDGLPVILSERKIEGLIVVNIPSFSGGVKLWNDEDTDTPLDLRRYGSTNLVSDGFKNYTKHRSANLPYEFYSPDLVSRIQRRKSNLCNRMNTLGDIPRAGSGSSTSSSTFASNRRSSLCMDLMYSQSPHVQETSGIKPDRLEPPCVKRALAELGDDLDQESSPSSSHSKIPLPLSLGDRIPTKSRLRHRKNVTPNNDTSISDNELPRHTDGMSNKRRHRKLVSSVSACPMMYPDASDVGPHYSDPNSVCDPPIPSPSLNTGKRFPLPSDGIYRRWLKQSVRDEIIEVVALRSIFHLGKIQVGLAEPLKVCQGREIRIEVPVEVPFQIDGEPRLLPPNTTIDISYKGKCFVLSPVKTNDDALLHTVTDVLDTAVRDSILTPMQRNCLLWELESRLR